MPAFGEIDENREARRWEVGCLPILIAANTDFFFPILVIVEEEEDKEEDLFCEEEVDNPLWTETGREEFIIASFGCVYKCDSKVVFFLKRSLCFCCALILIIIEEVVQKVVFGGSFLFLFSRESTKKNTSARSTKTQERQRQRQIMHLYTNLLMHEAKTDTKIIQN